MDIFWRFRKNREKWERNPRTGQIRREEIFVDDVFFAILQWPFKALSYLLVVTMLASFVLDITRSLSGRTNAKESSTIGNKTATNIVKKSHNVNVQNLTEKSQNKDLSHAN